MNPIVSYNGENQAAHAAKIAKAFTKQSPQQTSGTVEGAFFVPYNAAHAPYGDNSIVYVDNQSCQRKYYFLLCGPEYRAPHIAGNRWVEFNASTFISSMNYHLNPDHLFNAEHTSSDDANPMCMPNYKRVWPAGSIRCHDGKFYYSTAETATNPPSADWVGGSDNVALMKALINLTIS